MKKGDVIRQKCVNTTFYLTGILAHKVNNVIYATRYARGVTYSYITSKCKVTAVFNEGVARVETCCYFALMSYVTRLFTE